MFSGNITSEKIGKLFFNLITIIIDYHHRIFECIHSLSSVVPRGGGGAPTPSLGIDCETDPESGSSD